MAVLNSVLPKNANTVVLYGVPALNDSVLAVLEGLRASPKPRRVYLFVDSANDRVTAKAISLGAAGVLPKSSLRALWRYVRARYVLMTHDMYSARTPRSQVVMNLWHGELTKGVGQWSDDYVVKSTYSTAMSHVGAAFRCAEFGLHPDQVLITGSPRNDMMVRSDKASVRRRLGVPDDRTLVLWLPTLRHSAETPASGTPVLPTSALPNAGEPDALGAWLAHSGVQLVIKAHSMTPLAASEASSARLAINEEWLLERDVSLYELLAASDGLITDASSVWVDYLLLDRPVWIHFPDRSTWLEAGSHLLDPYAAWAPGPITTDEDGLIAELRLFFDDGEDRYAVHRRFLRDVLHRHDDANATQRILQALGLA
jgi:CDP-glycerol glycerophosphotransferase (TagB/SpsB family)